VRHRVTLHFAERVDETGRIHLLRALHNREVEGLPGLDGEPEVDRMVLIASIVDGGGVDARGGLGELDQAECNQREQR